MNLSPTRKKVNAIAAVVITGFIGVLVISGWYANKANYIHGPTVLATGDDDEVYFNLGKMLYQLDHDGEFQDSVSLTDLGINEGTLTDLLAIGNNILLIGIDYHPSIFRCDLDRRHCNPFINDDHILSAPFKFAWDRKNRELYVTESNKGKIYRYDADGRRLNESSNAKLKYPNAVMLNEQNELVITDTNHHRLVAIDATTLSDEQWEAEVNDEVGTPGRIWPTDVIISSNDQYWIIASNGFLKAGDVVSLDDQHQLSTRIPLADEWDPVRLRARTKDVVIIGYDSVDIVTAPLDGSSTQPFGAASFRAMLSDVREETASLQRWWDLEVWLALSPFILLAIVAAFFDKKLRDKTAEEARQTLSESASTLVELADEDGIYWLPWNAPNIKHIRRATWRAMRIASEVAQALGRGRATCNTFRSVAKKV